MSTVKLIVYDGAGIEKRHQAAVRAHVMRHLDLSPLSGTNNIWAAYTGDYTFTLPDDVRARVHKLSSKRDVRTQELVIGVFWSRLDDRAPLDFCEIRLSRDML